MLGRVFLWSTAGTTGLNLLEFQVCGLRELRQAWEDTFPGAPSLQYMMPIWSPIFFKQYIHWPLLSPGDLELQVLRCFDQVDHQEALFETSAPS